MTDAIETFTGSPGEWLTTLDFEVDDMWDIINDELSKNAILTAGSYAGTGSDQDVN